MVTMSLKQVARIQSHGMTLSEDGRRAVFSSDDGLQLLDTERGHVTPLGIPFTHSVYAVAPDGQTLVTIKLQVGGGHELAVWSPAGIHAEPLPLKKPIGTTICFSGDGRFLWTTARDANGTPRLALLDAKTLVEVDSIPKPFKADEFTIASSEALEDWFEPHMRLHVASDTLAVVDLAGDTMLGIYFFRHHAGRIVPAFERDIYDTDERVTQMCYAEAGDLFVAYDGLYYAFKLPSMERVWHGLPTGDLWDDRMELGQFTLIDHHLVTALNPLTPHEAPAEEFLVTDVVSGSMVGLYRHPHPLEGGFLLAGRTLVAFGEEDFVYRIVLQSS